MKQLFIAIILLYSATSIASDYLEVLKNHCEKSQSDHWVKTSEACRLVRGELKIDQLCDGYSKGHTKQSLIIDSIATDLAKIKSTSTESMVKDLLGATNFLPVNMVKHKT